MRVPGSLARRSLQLVVAVALVAAPSVLAAQGQVSRPKSSGPASQSSESGAKTSSESEADANGSPDESKDSGESESQTETETTPVSTSGSAPGEGESEASSEGNDEEEADDGGEPIADPVAYCDGFMRTHGESSARKLYRALAGENYDVNRLELRNAIELDVADGGETRSVRFEISLENGGRSAVLVAEDRDYRSTFVVTMTDSGPVVAKLEWPGRNELARKADCKPRRSWILHPDVPADEVEIDPFDYWGIRILWRIPSKFSEDPSSWESAEAALRELLAKPKK